MSIKNKRIESPDEVRSFENGKVEVVNLGVFSVLRMVLQPGWRWSKSVKPIVKTESCQSHHIGYVISGRLKVVASDGKEIAELQPRSVYEIMPGHDAWVVGDEPFIALELSQDTVAKYAKPLYVFRQRYFSAHSGIRHSGPTEGHMFHSAYSSLPSSFHSKYKKAKRL